MATLLPADPVLPKTRISRKHRPKQAPYGTYTPCLRWDFDFTCVYCRCHESDFIEGAAGAGLFWVEHFEPQSTHPSLKDIYENCFYACRFCNRARGTKPVQDDNGVRLLNPCEDAWADHFKVVDDSLIPTGARAIRTELAYRINADRNVRVRRKRREVITTRTQMLVDIAARVKKLSALSMSTNTEPDVRAMAVGWLRDLAAARAAAIQDLRRYINPPADRPRTCACN